MRKMTHPFASGGVQEDIGGDSRDIPSRLNTRNSNSPKQRVLVEIVCITYTSQTFWEGFWFKKFNHDKTKQGNFFYPRGPSFYQTDPATQYSLIGNGRPSTLRTAFG